VRQARPEATYAAVNQWVDVALRGDSSLFVPGASIWTAEALDDLYQRYNLRPDTSAGAGFDAKLQRQLEGAPDNTVQLMAEVTFVSLLVVDDITGATKRASVDKVLSWMDHPARVPEDLGHALDHGIAATGMGWKTWRWVQLAFVIACVRQWKTMPAEARMAALDDPWKFKSFLGTVPAESAYAQREALSHLVFPDVFEDIVAREHKARIRDTFHQRTGTESSGDVDRDLLAIREALSKEYGPRFAFYDPEIAPIWDPVATQKKPWDEFIGWARKIHEWSGFDSDEYDYKIADGERVAHALSAAASDSDEWLTLAEAALKATNLVRWQAWDNLLRWWREHPAEGRQMLMAIRPADTSLIDRVKGFIDPLPADLLSGADLLRVISFFFLGVDPRYYPPVAATPLAQACKLTGYPPPSAGADQARRYRHALAFFDRLMQEAENRGLRLRDRLDAQSVMWAVTENDPPPTFSDDERAAFLAWRSGQSVPAPAPAPAEGREEEEPSAPRTLQQLADELFVPEDFLDTLLALLRERGQLILYGPPGTGKTYVARKLMEFVAPESQRREVVQFHPSYSYEDFVEGYRPVTSGDGHLSYELRPGPLRRLAKAAAANRQEHVLLIDEINRGNLPRILGELLYALEYRAEPVRLMYSPDEQFVLPRNLLLLGTMNTADKSIGLIDAALRRRFHFMPLFPGEGPLVDLLAQWLDAYVPEMSHVAGIVDRLNAELRRRVGRHLQMGHSYFLRPDLSEEVLTRLWDADILPFLEDQFFGRDDDLAHFKLDRLREGGHEDSETEGVDPGAGAADEQ
jgi:5-methylcytosine-specific restriction enzyme B